MASAINDDADNAEISLSSPRKLTHEAGRLEQRMYWSTQSVAQRLAAMTKLTKRLYQMRGIDLDKRKADFTPRRVRRRQD